MNEKSTHKKRTALKGSLLGLIIIACFLIAAPQLAAQQNSESQQQNLQGQQSQEVAQAKQQAKEYAQKLKEIQESAIENNPELKKKRQEFQDLQEKKIKEKVSDDASREEKIKAQMELRQDEELTQMREDLEQDFLEAMEDEDPDTQEYMEKLTNARKKIQQMNQKRHQEQGQPEME